VLRKRVTVRLTELEDAITERRDRLDGLQAEVAAEAPSLSELGPLLSRLPLLAERLETLPTASIRRLFDALQLKVTLQPAENAVDIELTLAGGLDQAITHDPAQVWSVPPGEPDQTSAGLCA